MRYIASIPLRPYIATLADSVFFSSELEEEARTLSEMKLSGTDMHGHKWETREERSAAEILEDMRKRGQREAWIVFGTQGSVKKDLSQSREPIHMAFANWGSSPADIARFTKQYGLLWDCLADGQHLVSGKWVRSDFEFAADVWVDSQSTSRSWWRHRFGPVPEEPDAERKKIQEFVRKAKEELRRKRGILGPLPAETYFEKAVSLAQEISLAVFKDGKGRPIVELVAPDLWHYMSVLLLSEKHEMLRLCKREGCPTPYYIATRKDQKYCGTDCSQLVATRTWWAKHGKEWRNKRRKLGKKKRKVRR